MTERLEEIGKNIQALEDITRTLVSKNVGDKKQTWVVYDVTEGSCIGFGIYKEDRIAFQLVFCSKGTIFPKHIHKDEVEVIGVLNGLMKLTTPDCDELIIKERELHVLQPGEAHLAEFPDVDTWLWAITMPASEAYPDGR